MNNLENNTGTTPKLLINTLVSACFIRIANRDFQKLKTLKSTFQEMLIREKHKHKTADSSKYDELSGLIDSFFKYIEDEKILTAIENGRMKKIDLEERFLSEVADIPKRKYDMRDLYRPTLISSVKNDSNQKQVKLGLRNGETQVYLNEDNRKVYITEVGQIQYIEWNGSEAYISVYQVEKEKEDGTFSQNLVSTNIVVPDMEKQDYRDAVLNELLSDDNMTKSRVGPYIGQIMKRKKSDMSDLPRAERQNADEYTYRINDNYVLAYDATDLTAVVEVIRKYGPSIKSKLDKNDRRKKENDTPPSAHGSER